MAGAITVDAAAAQRSARTFLLLLAAGSTLLSLAAARPGGTGRDPVTSSIDLDARTRVVDPDSVRDYCLKCYERMGIVADSVADSFIARGGGAVLLLTSEAGVQRDSILPNGNANPNASATFPDSCDRPAWLELASERCYGHTYIQKFTINGTKGPVTGALLCRHKAHWSAQDTTYDDIAMILHNKKNGETCWFQSPDGASVALDGRSIPAPDTPRATVFWKKPSATASINCIRCHDNGPWMNSRWMDNSDVGLKDGRGRYVNGGAAFSTDWKEPKFITVAAAGLDEGGRGACTSCHKIHQADKTKNGGKRYQNAERWIDFTVGRQNPEEVNATGTSFDFAYWMPLGHGEEDSAAWNREYKKHVDAVLACCQKQGERDTTNRADPCAHFVPKAPPAPGPGAPRWARITPGIEISADVGGTLYECSAPPDCDGGVYTISPGSTVMLSWAVDSLHWTGAVEVTVPAGVAIGDIHTGTNWWTDESPRVIGPLTVPGIYRFDLSCDDEEHGQLNASLSFRVPGQPPTVQTIQAIVDTIGAGMAFSYPLPAVRHVEVFAGAADTVYVAWSSANTVSGTARLTESFVPPIQSPNVYADSSGFMQITLHPQTDQLYTFTATGNGGTPDTVLVTVHVDKGTTGVGDPTAPETAPAFALRIAGANPFSRRAGVGFEYDVPQSGAAVRIGIFDVAGRRVATLVDGRVDAGSRGGAWRGPTLNGFASGVYFLHMEAGDFRASRKLILID